MKISGIVSEYNPFHNGHAYHIQKTRENGATHIIAVMSGSLVQRGETAVMDKYCRAGLALRGGADLVLEIPAVCCISSAEFFARGAVSILHSLECVDEISFGSECGDIDTLEKAAEAAASIPDLEIEKKMKSGMTYPAAVSMLTAEKYGAELAEIISCPNNILGMEYLKALTLLGSEINPFTLCRKGSEHDSSIVCEDFASASYVRKLISEHKDFSKFVPEYVSREYRIRLEEKKLADMKNLERIILYRLRTLSAEQLRELPDVGQGLEYRLKQSEDSASLNELLKRVKTKRYTMARLRRILLNMLIGVTSEDLKTLPPYGHILAFNERGREILAKCKDSKILLSTSLSKLAKSSKAAKRFVFLEGIASDIYGLSQVSIGSKADDFQMAVRMEKNED